MPLFSLVLLKLISRKILAPACFMSVICQTLLVGGFQQSRTEKSVNLNGTADHAIGRIVEFHLRALRVLRGDSLPLLTSICPRNGTIPRLPVNNV